MSESVSQLVSDDKNTKYKGLMYSVNKVTLNYQDVAIFRITFR